MSESNDDINVGLKVTADTSQLKAALRDFDDTEESLKRLKDATTSLKGGIDDQVRAIRVLNQANRVQNYELLQGIRVLRSVVSVARDLNQVYQTLILRNIDATTTTVAQKESYEGARDAVERFIKMLDTFGAANDDVNKVWKDLIGNADDLTTKQLKNLIEAYRQAGESASLSADEQEKFNDGLASLQQLLKDTEFQENQKKFEDFFGGVTTAALAAGSVGTFALNLGKYKEEIATLVTTIGRFKPEITIIMILLFGMPVARELGLIQTAGGGEEKTELDKILESPLFSNKIELPNLTSRFNQQQNLTKIEISGNNFYFKEDVVKKLQEAVEEYERSRGARFP